MRLQIKVEVINVTLIYAHRGASKHAPENTYASFKLAQIKNADGIETDIQLTKDGVPVVIHDATLDRTTTKQGAIKEVTFAELTNLQNGQWFDPSFEKETLMSLDELLDWWQTTELYLNIELKSHSFHHKKIVKETMRRIDQIDDVSRLTISSFNLNYLEEVKAWNPIMVTGYLTKKRLSNRVLKRMQGVVDGIHLHYKAYTTDFYRCLQSHGFYLHLYTVNEAYLFNQYVSENVDGIITDDVDLMG